MSFSHVPTSLTNCFLQSMSREHCIYGALVVILAMLLRLLNCRFIIIILLLSQMHTTNYIDC